MELLERLSSIFVESTQEACAVPQGAFKEQERIGNGSNLLAVGDNLEFMRFLADTRGLKSQVQFIYIDPPFFSKVNYGSAIKLSYKEQKTIPALKQLSYRDSWQGGIEDYLRMLCRRLFAMKELLADSGLICVHLDWHAVHYVKIFMDAVFGEKNFVNEIVWQYKSGGSSNKRFARKHDTLLLYSKTKDYKFNAIQEKSYNRGYKPDRFKGVKEYRDEIGWYTAVNMKDVWQIDMVGRTSAERTGYVTQKPEALLSRLIEACTDPGDICADFFGGSGTMAAAAHKADRKWIYCDIGVSAALNAQKRLLSEDADFTVLYDERVRSACDFAVAIEERPSVTSENIVNIRITDCKPKDIAKIPVGEADREKIEQVVQKSPLQLVDYWSVDCNYDGVLHAPQMFEVKEKGQIACKSEMLCNKKGAISIRVVDIFGNDAIKVLA